MQYTNDISDIIMEVYLLAIRKEQEREELEENHQSPAEELLKTM
jgi:hypothetical protein